MGIISFLEMYGFVDMLWPFLVFFIAGYTIFNLINVYILANFWKRLKTYVVLLAAFASFLLLAIPRLLRLYSPDADPFEFINVSFIPLGLVIIIISVIINVLVWYFSRERKK